MNDRHEQMAEMWAEGASSSEIADKLGCDPNYVRVIARRKRGADGRFNMRSPGRPSIPKPSTKQTVGRRVAERAAREIRIFWANKGYAVEVNVEQGAFTDRECSWLITTDMINGLPRDFRAKRRGIK